MSERAAGSRFLVTVGASSKKAGKSSLAAFLVRELGACCALKVSSGGEHDGLGIVSDPERIATPGTDTGALVRAGARRVLWVCADPGRLPVQLRRALDMLPGGGLVVVEGNSAAAHLSADFSVFVMSAPFESFKPSAWAALGGADLVLVGLGGEIPESFRSSVERELASRAPGARTLFFPAGRNGFEEAMRETARRIKEKMGPGREL